MTMSHRSHKPIPLAEYLSTQKPLSARMCREIANQVAGIIQEVHAQGLYCRNLDIAHISVVCDTPDDDVSMKYTDRGVHGQNEPRNPCSKML